MFMQDVDAIMNDSYSRRLSNTEKTSNGYERNRVCNPEQRIAIRFSTGIAARIGVTFLQRKLLYNPQTVKKTPFGILK